MEKTKDATSNSPRVIIQLEPIAVKPKDAAALLGITPQAFYLYRPDLVTRGMLHAHGRYDVQSLRTAWAKLCKDEMDK